MGSWNFKVWLKVEQIKALEREGKAWGGEHGDQDNHPGKTGA